MSYSFLKPVRIGNMVLKNRVIVPAMARYLCKDGYVTDAYVEYLRAIAEGGVAMVTVGIMPIDLNWPSTMPTQPCLGDDKYIPGLTRAVAAIHAGGAKASLQPWMPGRAPYTYANAVERAQDIAIVNRLTVDEIHNIQKKYAAAALRCAMAGADVVEWHNAHNYLGEQFFSPYFNHRTDEYGQQSVENSMRFAREALALTRRTLDAAGYAEIWAHPRMRKSFIIWSISMILYFYGYYGLITWLPNYVQSQVGMQSGGWITAAGYIAMIIGTAGGGKIADKIGRKKLFLIGTIGTAIFGLCLAFWANSSNILVLMLLYGVCYGMPTGIHATFIGECFPTHLRSTGVGFTFNIGRLGAFVAPILMGKLVDMNMISVAIATVTISYVLCSLATLPIKEREYDASNVAAQLED